MNSSLYFLDWAKSKAFASQVSSFRPNVCHQRKTSGDMFCGHFHFYIHSLNSVPGHLWACQVLTNHLGHLNSWKSMRLVYLSLQSLQNCKTLSKLARFSDLFAASQIARPFVAATVCSFVWSYNAGSYSPEAARVAYWGSSQSSSCLKVWDYRPFPGLVTRTSLSEVSITSLGLMT